MINVNGSNIAEETPSTWGDPNEFDGFRFARIREENAADVSKLQFVTTTLDSMQFGHGKYACPGHFSAATEIKSILAYLVTHYEIKFADGEKGRPKNFEFETQVIPDPSKKILFKRIA